MPDTAARPARPSRRSAPSDRRSKAAALLLGALLTGPQALWAAEVRCSAPERIEAARVLPWATPEGLDPRAGDALRMLIDAHRHGLRSSDYGATTLARNAYRLTRSDRSDTGASARFNRQLTAALECYLGHLRYGSVEGDRIHSLIEARDRSSLLSEIESAWHAGEITALEAKMTPSTPRYGELVVALSRLRAAADVESAWAAVTIPPGETLRRGERNERVSLLRSRLRFLGDLQDLPDLGEQADDHERIAETFDPGLEAAVARFQARHGLEVDGLVGRNTLAELNTPLRARIASVEMSLERLRWLPRETGALVLVNVPEFRLDAGLGPDAVDLQSRVVVGRSGQSETPLFQGRLTRLELNPYWNVPHGIMRDEILPRLRKDPDLLRRKRMEIVRAGGVITQQADAAVIQELRRGRARLRQLPGPGNALGRIKFVLPNHRAIFLHDTSQPQLFSRTRRDFSHGCVRVEQPVALAKLLLRGETRWDEARVDAALASGERIVIRPRTNVTVALTYMTATVDGNGMLRFHPDIYGVDERTRERVARWQSHPPAGPDTERRLARGWIRALTTPGSAA